MKTINAASNSPNASDNAFFSVMTALDLPTLVCDQNMTIINCSPCFAHLLELPKDLFETGRNAQSILNGIYGCEDLDLNTRDTNRGHGQSHQQYFPASTSVSHIRADGQPIDFNRIVAPTGEIITIGRICTESATHKNRLDSALTNAQAGYWSYSFATKRYTLSQYFHDIMTDAEIAQVENHGLWDIIHPDDVNGMREAWEKSFSTHAPIDHTFRINLNESGVRILHNIGQTEYANTGKPIGVISFITDETVTVETQEVLRAEKRGAEKALRSSKEFLAHMSHEIRTPMNGVLGMTDALLHSGNADNITKELGIIKSSAKNLLRVLDDTLDHAKLFADKIKIQKSATSIAQMLHGVHQLWTDRAAESGTKLTLTIDAAMPSTVDIDQFRVEQCLNNILSNAVKFTDHGQIHIIAKYLQSANETSRIAFAVKDNGIGMNTEQQAHVFTAYQQANSDTHVKYGGTGLGMSIVKSLTTLMDGRISFKSAPNEGSTFVLTFPVDDAISKTHDEVQNESRSCALPLELAPQQPPLPPQSVSPLISVTEPAPAVTLALELEPDLDPNRVFAPRNHQTTAAPAAPVTPLNRAVFMSQDAAYDTLKGLTVLVAEDNHTNQIVVSALLEPLVKKTIFASNGQEALDVLSHHAVDVVLMDIHMPIMDGIEATLAIRTSSEHWKDVPIIALTADPEYQQLRICRNIGMNEALAKPVSRSELVDAFSKVFAEQIQSTPALQRANSG